MEAFATSSSQAGIRIAAWSPYQHHCVALPLVWFLTQKRTVSPAIYDLLVHAVRHEGNKDTIWRLLITMIETAKPILADKCCPRKVSKEREPVAEERNTPSSQRHGRKWRPARSLPTIPELPEDGSWSYELSSQQGIMPFIEEVSRKFGSMRL